MEQTHNLNLNADACIKSVSNIGHKVYVNICNGDQSIVEWGSGDWITFFIGGGLILILIAVLFYLIWLMTNY